MELLAVPKVRRRRSEWPDTVRQDPEVQELDEENGECLCCTCAEHYERTHKGRKPNDAKGIVPDAFYRKHVKLVRAFAKYYVGAYRVNVVRDLRSNKVMLFSHDCENRVIHRERTDQPDFCQRRCSIWLHNKSFKRALKKADRYTLVGDILRHSWSVSAEDASVLSKFQPSSDMDLNLEGRKLKQAAMTAFPPLNGASQSLFQHNESAKCGCKLERTLGTDQVTIIDKDDTIRWARQRTIRWARQRTTKGSIRVVASAR
ncbi:unnamed protein product [Peronospora destructor]|uniref:Uncharacterized protein n=1 Tax=Peronospora destructor TaxID=86335 RepID=A0AAV0V927_9STRA|nr:unnamed protein product [Peronospora destructor]